MAFCIQRVLEHCHDPKTQQIMMDEILQSVCMLAQDQYGNYVVQVCDTSESSAFCFKHFWSFGEGHMLSRLCYFFFNLACLFYSSDVCVKFSACARAWEAT